MYQKFRGIPSANVLKLAMAGSREITRDQFRIQVATPVRKYLEANPAIRCIISTSGVPYTIRPTAGMQDGSALDNELAAVLRDEPPDFKGWQPNPLYLRGQNQTSITDPRALKMVYVVRLDGPDLKTITRMVEDTIAAEKVGLQGPVFGDARGLDGAAGFAEADASVRQAIDRLSGAGFESKLDLTEAAWMQPTGKVSEQAAGAAFYVGWSSARNFQDIFGSAGLARGSIAWQISDGGAGNLWDPGSQWCVNLLKRGAGVTLGSVGEAYVQAFPRGDLLVERLLAGATVAESYWLALPHVSWNMVVLGDPLYRPFGLTAAPSLVAKAYIVSSPNRVLKSGQPSSLLIELQSIGPAGSTTPALEAAAEAGLGLVAASGSVSIPPLRAGERTIVRVPRVVAGSDPTGMFRLHLNVRTSGGRFRQIVLEGRIGFSRLTAGLIPAAQMFVSPDGKQLISGQPGNSRLIDVESLQSRDITLSERRMAVVGATFAPGSNSVAIALVDPREKKAGIVITDRNLRNVQMLPAGTEFLRWLGPDTVLLKGTDSLISHSLTGEPNRVFHLPAGWGGTIIPNTSVRVLLSPDGKLALQQDTGAPREVLASMGRLRYAAVANDLSIFGGVDSENRLWIQRGFAAQPELAANGVKQVIWGPISHRGLVQDINGNSRIYDTQTNSWKALGTITAAQWSPNEEQLLIVESAQKGSELTPTFLSIFAADNVTRLSSFERIGQLAQMHISESGRHAFLLAALTGGMDVWMTELPPLSGLP